jgi:hypothetical protein
VIKSARLPDLSPTARKLLRSHRPGLPAYLSWALGPVKTTAGLVQIDAAYAELVAAELVTASEVPIAVLAGEARHPFTLTAAGDRLRHLARI